jgi:hypothetical protein
MKIVLICFAHLLALPLNSQYMPEKVSLNGEWDFY